MVDEARFLVRALRVSGRHGLSVVVNGLAADHNARLRIPAHRILLRDAGVGCLDGQVAQHLRQRRIPAAIGENLGLRGSLGRRVHQTGPDGVCTVRAAVHKELCRAAVLQRKSRAIIVAESYLILLHRTAVGNGQIGPCCCIALDFCLPDDRGIDLTGQSRPPDFNAVFIVAAHGQQAVQNFRSGELPVDAREAHRVQLGCSVHDVIRCRERRVFMPQTGQVRIVVGHIELLDVLHIAQRQADRAFQIAFFQSAASSEVDSGDRRTLEAGHLQRHAARHIDRRVQVRAMVDAQFFQHGQRGEVQLDCAGQVDVGIAGIIAAYDDRTQLGGCGKIGLIGVHAGDALHSFQHGCRIDVDFGVVQRRVLAHAQRHRLAALATLLLQDGAEQDRRIQVRVRRDGDRGNLAGRACEATQGDFVVPGNSRVPLGREIDAVVFEEVVPLEPFVAVHHGDEHGNGRAALLQILVGPDILAPCICNEQAFRAKGLICVKRHIQAVSIEQLRQGRDHRVQTVGQKIAHVDPQDRILRVEHVAAVELVGVLHAVVQRQIALVVVAHGRVEVVAEAVIPDGMRSGHILAVRKGVLCTVVRHGEERGEQVMVQGGLALEVLVKLVHELGGAVFCRVVGVGRAAVGHRAAQRFAGRCCAVGRIDPLHHIAPCVAGHSLITGVRDVAEGQGSVRVVITFPAGSVCRTLIALEAVVDMGIVAQLHDALIRARCAVKALRLFVLLGVAEIAHAVENPLALCETFLGALVVHEHDTRMELHRVAHLGIRRPGGADVRLVLVEQLGQHSIVHVLAGCNVQLEVEVGFAHTVLGHVVGVGLRDHAVFGVDELALAVEVHVAARLAVGVGGRALPTVDNALVLPAVLCASAIQEVLHAAAGNLVVLVGREARDTQLDDTQTRPGLCQIVDVGFINGRCVPVGDDVARAIVHRIAFIPSYHLVRVGCVRNEVVHHVGIAEADIVELAAVQPHITIRAADGQRDRVALG